MLRSTALIALLSVEDERALSTLVHIVAAPNLALLLFFNIVANHQPPTTNHMREEACPSPTLQMGPAGRLGDLNSDSSQLFDYNFF